MRGTIEYQIIQVYKETGMNCLGASKHTAKELARSEGAHTWSAISEQIGIFSISAYQDYVNIAKDALNYAKTEYGLRDVTRVENHMIQSWLVSKVSDGVARQTYNTYSAAIHKFQTGLIKYSDIKGLGRTYDFKLPEVAKFAAEQLGAKNVSSRAYKDAAAVAASIPGKHNLLGNALQESGARISEMSNLRADQFRGLGPDPHSGVIKGWVEVVGKGGKRCMKGLTPATYNRLEQAIGEGKAKFNQGNFRAELKIAALKNGEKYSGAHSLRWSWAQDKHAELQKLGYSYETSLSLLSKMMSHNRSDISRHYLI